MQSLKQLGAFVCPASSSEKLIFENARTLHQNRPIPCAKQQLLMEMLAEDLRRYTFFQVTWNKKIDLRYKRALFLSVNNGAMLGECWVSFNAHISDCTSMNKSWGLKVKLFFLQRMRKLAGIKSSSLLIMHQMDNLRPSETGNDFENLAKKTQKDSSGAHNMRTLENIIVAEASDNWTGCSQSLSELRTWKGNYVANLRFNALLLFPRNWDEIAIGVVHGCQMPLMRRKPLEE